MINDYDCTPLLSVCSPDLPSPSAVNISFARSISSLVNPTTSKKYPSAPPHLLFTSTSRPSILSALAPTILSHLVRASTSPYSLNAPFLNSRSTLICLVGASPISDNVYSQTTYFLGTFKRSNKSAISTPVRLFPVVQCMNNAGGGSKFTALAIKSLKTFAITCFPDSNTSTNALTISCPHKLAPHLIQNYQNIPQHVH
jgi:hypothetical protein